MWRRQKSSNDGNSYDALIKTALTGHLGEAVREVQRQQAAAPTQHIADIVETNSESAHTLCCVLEALFIHRLRDSFIDKVSSVFSGDVIRQPAPNFWPFLLAFSHRNSVEHLIQDCSWLRTDIGRCRGWIRLVLNDGLLSSYLELLANEKRLVGDFYEKEAFLRDGENLDIARKILNGIEALQFKLAVNSSILNSWSSTPLLLAGLWAPPTPVIREAVVQGVDAALCFSSEDETKYNFKPSSANRRLATPTVDEDLAFRLIIESISDQPSLPINSLPSPSTLIIDSLPQCAFATKSSEDPDSGLSSTETVVEEEVLVTHLRPKSNRSSSPIDCQSLTDPVPLTAVNEEGTFVATSVKHEESFEDSNELGGLTEEILQENSVPQDEPECTSKRDLDSSGDVATCYTFQDLLNNYSSTNVSGFGQKSPDFIECLKSRNDDRTEDEEEFEVISGENKCYVQYMKLLMNINREQGLMKQDYQCLDCSQPIGIIYGKAKVCGFTGGSYCSDCFQDDEAIIPARVFLNGDWSKRKVCRSAFDFMQQIQLEPRLNALKMNSRIYSVQPEFAALVDVRTQLHHLGAYLLSCRSGIGEEFRKKVWPKEHLFEQIHAYAIADLPLIQSGQLQQQLMRLVQFGKSHVTSCELCSLKGFICEICHDKTVLFPFDLVSTFRCAACGAVYHKTCLNLSQPCPRCERWKRSDDGKE